MSKMEYFVLSSLVAVGVVSYVFFRPELPPSFSKIPLRENTATYSISGGYPSFVNAPNKLNEEIISSIQKRVGEFKRISEDNATAWRATRRADDPLELPYQFEMKLDYDVAQATEREISVVLTSYEYSGGAHGMSYTWTVNWDVKNNRAINLADVYGGVSDYLYLVSQSIKPKLVDYIASQVGNPVDDFGMQMIEDGTSPKIENFSAFSLTPTEITFYFQPYQVGPYSLGEPEITLGRPLLD